WSTYLPFQSVKVARAPRIDIRDPFAFLHERDRPNGLAVGHVLRVLRRPHHVAIDETATIPVVAHRAAHAARGARQIEGGAHRVEPEGAAEHAMVARVVRVFEDAPLDRAVAELDANDDHATLPPFGRTPEGTTTSPVRVLSTSTSILRATASNRS